MPATLAETLVDDRIDFEELSKSYRPVLQMVDILIGVVPNCDPYLEIWPAGFRTYNLMVPNFLNLPNMLVGQGAPKDLVGLGMYMSSRAAECNYCSAHTCSFALRRGSTPEAITGEERTDAEAAVVALAEGLSTMPHTYDPKLADEVENHLGPDNTAWVAMGAAMMGFLNKFMDALGVELEAEAVNDVAALIEPTGWEVGQHNWAEPDLAADEDAEGPGNDSIWTFLKVGRNAPGAVRLERQWMKGIPKKAEKLQPYIADNFGYDEPLLALLRHDKPRRALAAMLRHNLDPEQSAIGIGAKALTGLIFANYAGNDYLGMKARDLARHHGVGEAAIELVGRYHPEIDTVAAGIDQTTAAALMVAQATSPSPAAVDDAVIEAATSFLTPAQRVEVVVWVSVCQLLHRLSLFHGLAR
ncbi:MAG: hypothetical protein AAGD35_02495 [Actinomycetota bacterium]